MVPRHSLWFRIVLTGSTAINAKARVRTWVQYLGLGSSSKGLPGHKRLWDRPACTHTGSSFLDLSALAVLIPPGSGLQNLPYWAL